MGWTHFDRVSAIDGLGFGTATAGETTVIDASGNVTIAGTLTGSAGVSYDTYQGVITETSTDAGTTWHVSPYACNVAGYVSFSVSSGTGRTVTVVHGSAGDNALSSGTSGVLGTIGKVVTFTASAVPSFTAGEVFRIVQTSCATSQVCGVTIVLTKT